MPVHDWKCDRCGDVQRDVYQPRLAAEPPVCCRIPMERLWSTSSGSGGGSYPYVTSNITGSPIEVRSPGHERELCRKHGVRKRDDAGWVDTRVEATGRGPRVIEGSGRGMPGCWS